MADLQLEFEDMEDRELLEGEKDVDREEDALEKDVIVKRKATGAQGKRKRHSKPAKDLLYQPEPSRNLKFWCKYVVCATMAVLVATTLSASVGLFVGQSIGRKAVGGTGSSTPATYDWGDTVTIEGRTLNVSDYFTAHISEEVISDYLA